MQAGAPVRLRMEPPSPGPDRATRGEEAGRAWPGSTAGFAHVVIWGGHLGSKGAYASVFTREKHTACFI